MFATQYRHRVVPQHIVVYCVQCTVYCVRCVVCGVWCVVCGVWCVVCGVVYGVWCMVYGVWCMVYGLVRYGMAWSGMVQCGMAWHVMTWLDMRCDMAYDVQPNGRAYGIWRMTWYGMAHGIWHMTLGLECDMRYVVIWYDRVRSVRW